MRVWVNGCFDILHTGHLDLLEFAKFTGNEFGNMFSNSLFVGIDSDRRVSELKGENRPINNQADRKRMLKSLQIVDDVLIFDSADELRYLIKQFDIDVMVVGDQYKNKEVIGSENAKGGVIYYPVDERSTTNIINKIKEVYE